MQTKMSKYPIIFRIASIIAILTGVILVTYMITVEGELGAIPLLFLIIGVILFIISKLKFKNI